MSDTDKDLNLGDETLIKDDNDINNNHLGKEFEKNGDDDVRVTENNEEIGGKEFTTESEILIGAESNLENFEKVVETNVRVSEFTAESETLIGDSNLENFEKAVESDVRVTESYQENDSIEEIEFVVEDDINLSDFEKFAGNSGGKEFGAESGTVIGDDINLSDFEKIPENSSARAVLETDVAVMEIDNENEKFEGNNLSRDFEKSVDDSRVVLESQNGLKVVGTEKENGENEEKDSVFGASDLVWGKVRSHPWWPGQIFDASDASEKAQKISKKDGILIAYFGDKSYAWNEEAKIKPFRDHFVSMEKQSKSESFSHAVECALEEVSRRVEVGLACKCLSDEVYDKIKSQTVVNPGIRKESSTREGGDVYSSVESFVPLDLVRYVEGLAKSPSGGTDRLEFVTAKAQLLAFNRHKGFPDLPVFQVFGLLDDDELLKAENDGDVPLKKEMGTKGSSKRRNKISNNSGPEAENERDVPDSKRKSHRSSSLRKRKVDTYVADTTMVEEKNDSLSPTAQNQFSNVGKRICSVISVLKESGNGSLLSSSRKKAGRKKVIPVESTSSDEILSHLYSVARGPVKGHSALRSIISFLSDMRNQISSEKSEQEKLSDELPSEEVVEELPKVESMGASGLEGFEDSYWTDRLVVSDNQEQVLFETETVDGNTTKSESPNGNGIMYAESDPNLVPNMETSDHITVEGDEECNPTALILNFTDIESVPSQPNLNNIFRRYGPLNETGTEISKKSKRAKVIFKRRADAETAFSSSGKFSIFGPSLVSYRLHYLPTKQEEDSPPKKRSKKVQNQ